MAAKYSLLGAWSLSMIDLLKQGKNDINAIFRSIVGRMEFCETLSNILEF